MAITKIEVPELFDFGSDNSAFKLPTGTTAERPTSPSNGEMRFNTTTGYVEYYDTTDTQWWEIDYVPDPVVPSENFGAVLYTGGSQQTVSLSFEPDFIWLKSRGGNYGHMLFDSVSGIDLPNDYYMQSNTAAAQVTSTNRFTLNGTTMTIPVGSNVINSSAGSPYVMWYWKAGGAAVTIAANTVGNTIASDVSANVDAGFSIVSYTGNSVSGATVAHKLDSTPEIAIIKCRSTGNTYWFVPVPDIVTGKYLFLNTSSVGGTGGFAYDATNITLNNTFGDANTSGRTYIAYCFHSVDGFSKIGSYTGSGTTLQTITTGFEPAFIMFKNTDAGNAWTIMDNKRNTTNPRNLGLFPNLSNSEYTYPGTPNGLSFTSTGFTLDTGQAEFNQNNLEYIFMAFAADPT
tara:strand:+ start:396 stop:1601 length:1206 start_codon:yes stop_codon:yes gene_type:complete